MHNITVEPVAIYLRRSLLAPDAAAAALYLQRKLAFTR